MLCPQKGLYFAVGKMSPLDKRQWIMLVWSWKGCGYAHLVIQYVFLLATPDSPDLWYAETVKKTWRLFLLSSSQGEHTKRVSPRHFLLMNILWSGI